MGFGRSGMAGAIAAAGMALLGSTAAWAADPVAPFTADPRGQAPCPEGSARTDTVYATGFESGITEPIFAQGWEAVETSTIEGDKAARSILDGSSADPDDYFFLPVVSATGSTYLGLATRGSMASGKGEISVNSFQQTVSGTDTWTGRIADITAATQEDGGLLTSWFTHYRTPGDAANWDLDNVQIFTCREANTSRVTGADRYAVSAAIADSYPVGVRVAYVARGDAFPDALTAVPVAAGNQAPVLLVKPGEIPPPVADALERLRPQRIIILGGTASVEPELAQQLRAYTDGSVSRIAGADRYAVSAVLSEQAFPDGSRQVYVASGEVFADALSAAPLASGATADTANSPLLLTRAGSIPQPVIDEVVRLRPDRITVVGGPVTVRTEVLAHLRDLTGASIERIYGPDRYAVSAQVAEAFGSDVDGSYLASGADFPDAILGAALAGARHQPLLLTKGAELPDTVRDRLEWLREDAGTVVGGEASVASIVRDRYGRTLP